MEPIIHRDSWIGLALKRIGRSITEMGHRTSKVGIRLIRYGMTEGRDPTDIFSEALRFVRVIKVRWISQDLNQEDLTFLPECFLRLSILLSATELPNTNKLLLKRLSACRSVMRSLSSTDRREMLDGGSPALCVQRRLSTQGLGDMCLTREDICELENLCVSGSRDGYDHRE